LNRVASPFWAKVRGELEEWFADYVAHASADKIADLRARFRSPDRRQHLPAWWELYVFRMLRLLFPQKVVVVEQEVAAQGTRPDFSLGEEDAVPDLFVEAVTPFSGIVEEGRHSAREAVLLDAINELDNPDFRVWITFRAVGPEQIKKRDVLQPLQAWLANLDRETVLESMQQGGPLPELNLQIRGWDIELKAVAKGRPGLDPDDRLVGIGHMSVGFVNDVQQIREAIDRKKDHYGDLEKAFVLAVMPMSPTFADEDAIDVLYGSDAVRVDPENPEVAEPVRLPDGAWRGAGRVSAVLFGPGIAHGPWPKPGLRSGQTREPSILFHPI
jgi:hypothetical protein